MAFGLQPTWPLHLQRLSGYTEIQLARLATLLLAHHGGAQVLFNFSSLILFSSCHANMSQAQGAVNWDFLHEDEVLT